jgi:hypothetical protein
LTINGTSFLSSSTVTYNGVGHTATFVSSTQLTISLSASDQATAGSYPVVITNPPPGGGSSNSVNFAVNAPPLPVITSVTPILAQTSQTIVISGSGFGNTPPQTVTLADGSVDTVACNTTTPSLVISDSGGGNDNWSAGQQTCSNTDPVGVYLVSWTDSQIVLSGFGSALGAASSSQGAGSGSALRKSSSSLHGVGSPLDATSSSPYQIAPGDPISINVTGPNGAGNVVQNTAALPRTQVVAIKNDININISTLAVTNMPTSPPCSDSLLPEDSNCFSIQQNFYLATSSHPGVVAYWGQNVLVVGQTPSGGWELIHAFNLWSSESNGNRMELLYCGPGSVNASQTGCTNGGSSESLQSDLELTTSISQASSQATLSFAARTGQNDLTPMPAPLPLGSYIMTAADSIKGHWWVNGF